MDDEREQQPSPGSEANPSRPSRPSPGAGAASARSSRGSRAASSPFIGDPGPAFEPGAGDAEPGPTGEPVGEQPGPDPLLAIEWDAERMTRALRVQGMATHALVGVRDLDGQRSANDWLWTDAELAAAAPAFAALANRFPASRAAAAVSDELGAAGALITYATRSIAERSRVLRTNAAAEPVPVTGVPSDAPYAGTFEVADPGPGPAGEPPYAPPAPVRIVPPSVARRHNGGPRIRAEGDQPLPGDFTPPEQQPSDPIEGEPDR